MIYYLKDADVDSDLDTRLRYLLSECFDGVFRSQRFASEQPAHRWLMTDGHNLVAHVAAHEKTVSCIQGVFCVLGISEACVSSAYRRQGRLSLLLKEAHDFGAKHEFDFALLFGYARFYTSSGYHPVSNLCDENGEAYHDVMYASLNGQTWPQERVRLDGLRF